MRSRHARRRPSDWFSFKPVSSRFGKNRSIVHARSSRNNLVPTSPSSSLTSKCQNIEGISVDQRLPEGPLIKTSGRGNNLYIFYETNVGILPFRRLLHAPVEINVLTHVERFIVTKQGSVNVSTAKLCRPLCHP